ncbi:MAG: hypothetical protein IPI15_02200 [Saprospiraceae bacterium]|uniref:MbnP family protein n=1 Tax=Candidatus Brachybacter algidus TaxID=2982024 RepID=UPI002579E443|nr:MbnP family protein [Candidatus Brachybacter algidus]MBK7602394.1 hypothetical protein [Candidatus Brachybacter algidus]
MKKIFLSFSFLLFYMFVYCQKPENINITLEIVFNNDNIILDDSVYQTDNGTSIKFETLKFYISQIQLLKNDKVVFAEQNSYHLIDIFDPASLNILLTPQQNINFNKIKFSLGVDSVTNVSGAMGGDLDPTKGMYWTWQSGYINFKMEGRWANKHNLKNEFEFHLGGYQYPYNPVQTVELTTTDNNWNIVLDLGQFFNAVNLDRQKSIMSPCADAVLLSRQVAKCFRIR